MDASPFGSFSARHTSPVSMSTSTIQRPHGLSNRSTFTIVRPYSCLGVHEGDLIAAGGRESLRELFQGTARHLSPQYRARSTWHMLTIALALAACGDSPTDPTPGPSVGGPWEGPIFNSTLTLLLFEVDGNVNGTAVINPAVGADQTFDVNGTQVQQNVNLSMTANGYQPFTLSGRVSATQIRGALNGSGFSGDSIFLAKCPC